MSTPTATRTIARPPRGPPDLTALLRAHDRLAIQTGQSLGPGLVRGVDCVADSRALGAMPIVTPSA